MDPEPNVSQTPHGRAGGFADALSALSRLLADPRLDELSRARWWVPPLLYGPCILALLALSVRSLDAATILMGAALGYGVWTLTEYLGHRFVFHADLPGELGARLHVLIHGAHHEHPEDPLRLVMPALLSAPLLLAALAATWLLIGFPAGFPPMTGFLIGSLGYDMTHYWVHQGAPRTRIGRSLRRNHMRHHFQDPNRGFGVSGPWWDHVFGTAHPSARRRAAAK